MTLEEFIVAAEITFEKLMTPIRGLPPDLMEEPMAEGKWSFKDLAAHIIFWDELVVRALEELNFGRDFDWRPYVGHFNEWNAKAAERMKHQSMRRVLTELRLTHSTVTEALRRVPQEKLFGESDPPRFLTWIMIGHAEHHIPQVEEWAARMRQEGRAPQPLCVFGGE